MKKILFSIVLATLCFSAAHAQQFGDWEIVCWDSSGVTIPLQVRVSTANSTGALIRTFYRFTPGALTKVVPTVGTISACGNSQLQQIVVNLQTNLVDNDTLIAQIQNLINIQNNITVNLDSLLGLVDSIAGNTEQPQICDCVYEVNQRNWSYTVTPGTKNTYWNANRFVTRDCGGGVEEIFSQDYSELEDLDIYVGYTNSGLTNLTSGTGYIDSFVVFLKNPLDTLTIWLHPDSLATRYPTLTFPKANLVFNAASTSTWVTAVKAVIAKALQLNAAANQLVPPQNIPFVTINSSGAFIVGFEVIHQPIGYYCNIRHDAEAGRMYYHPTGGGGAGTASIIKGRGQVSGISQVSYVTSCGTIATTYSEFMLTTRTGIFWDSLAMKTSPAPTTSGVGSITCSETCPNSPTDCVEICNDISNPIPVVVITNESDCPVGNIVEIPLSLTAQSSTLSGNFYHSVTISVTSGTVTISAVNPSGTTSGTFASGKTFTATAKECELIPTSFIINATSGAVTVATIR